MVQLLDRSGRRIRLTEAGEILYRHSLDIIRLWKGLTCPSRASDEVGPFADWSQYRTRALYPAFLYRPI